MPENSKIFTWDKESTMSEEKKEKTVVLGILEEETVVTEATPAPKEPEQLELPLEDKKDQP
jgi:hypothetical protein